MALPRTSLRGFLVHAKHLLHTAQTRQSAVTLVIGNESADLDSISSAIVHSYVASISPQRRSPPIFHIPIINIPKADIALRPELLALLPKANISREHLITLDDLGDLSTIETRLKPADTRWILVDHNRLQGRLGNVYSDHVVGTIDHHEDEGTVPEDTGDEARIISTCGSCTSLVIQHLRHSWDSWFLNVSFSGAANGQGDNLIEDGAFATLWDAQVAQLALAPILIDTANLKDKNKTTETDVESAEYLENKIRMSMKLGKDYRRDDFWKEIQEAKEDLAPLPIRDILRKDYKAWTEKDAVLGTAAVVRPISFLQDKAKESGKGSLTDQCESFAEEFELDVLSVMTAYTSDDKFERQLMLVSGKEAGKKVIKQFAEASGKELDLYQIDQREDVGWLHMIWQQRNLAASRKQIAPLLRKAMATS